MTAALSGERQQRKDMTTIDNLLEGSATTRQAAADFIRDPLAFFDMSLTKMQSVPRDTLEELQTAALTMRFEQQRERIPALAMLAEAQGITRVGEFNEILPVCFEHTIFKSYPGPLLERGKFDKLTAWMNQLTVHDLSRLDTSRCESIHAWLDLLRTETAVDPLASSGTTGTMSFTPRDASDWRTQILGGFRLQMLQEFGKPPSEGDLHDKLHVCWPTHGNGHTSVFRSAHYMRKFMAMEHDDHFHPMYDTPGDTDLTFLAARLRIAQMRGDDQVNVLPSLLARRGELEAEERGRPAKVAAWVESLISDMSGKRVFIMSPWMLLYDVAKAGLAAGRTCQFAPRSIIQTGGGGKGMVMADDWLEVSRRFFNAEFKWVYGFSETAVICARCEHGRYHVPPWAIPLMLDAQTGRPLPRKGVQVGRAAFFDLAVNGVWGGCISGDKIELDWNPCPCGRTSAHISDNVARFSELQGGVDEIVSPADPKAQAKVMNFLGGF